MADDPVWLDPRLIETVHERLLAEHGGALGVRDPRLDRLTGRGFSP